jgi:hypothetical protein
VLVLATAIMSNDDAVRRAVSNDIRRRQLDLTKSLARQREISAELHGVNGAIESTQQALTELHAFAAQRGWAIPFTPRADDDGNELE